MMNLFKINLTLEQIKDAQIYASALDEIGGAGAAELLLEDDEDDSATQKLKRSLKGTKRDEVQWALGWFRGAADMLECDPVAILRAGRKGVKLEEVA